VSGGSLKSKHTRSCGCLQIESRKLAYGEAAFNRLLLKYKLGAESRNLEFKLSKQEFKYLTKQDCHYCNIEPKQIFINEKHNGNYTYNGIDRKDNNRGYIIDNCVPCCFICNRAKNNLSYNEFIKWN